MYIRSKTFTRKNGAQKTYLYLVEARRFKDKDNPKKSKVRQVTIASLGEQEKFQAKIPQVLQHLIKWSKEKLELLDLAKDLSPDEALEFGPKIIFERIWSDLGLDKIINKLQANTKHRFNLEQALFSSVLNRIVEPKSELATCNLWANNVYGLEKFQLHQYYRSLDFLIEHKPQIEQDLFHNIRDLFNLEVDLVLFDTSSIIYRGDGDRAEEILDYGFSKEKRFDLKQVVIGVLMSKQGLPLAHFVYPGNTNDFSAFPQMLDEAKSKFPIRRVVFVFDKGMTSKKNLQKLVDNHDEYIAGARIRQLSSQKREKLLAKIDMQQVKQNLWAQEVVLDDQRYIVCYNPKQAQKDLQRREEVIARLRENLKTKGLKSLLVSKEYSKYVTIKADKPKLNEEKILAEELFDGMFVLTTNNKDLSPPEIVAAYKDLQKVERAFRCLKTELQIGPIYHHTEPRIRAHIMVAFLALVLRITLEKKLNQINPDLSFSKVLADIKKIKAVKFKVKDKEYVMRTEIQGEAYQAFKVLNLKPPLRTLEQP